MNLKICLLYARAYNQREKLEDSFVLDLAKRLPFEAKQKYLEFLVKRIKPKSW